MLSAISQSKGHRTHDSTHARSLDSEFIFKFTETESRMVVSRSSGEREKQELELNDRVSVFAK